MISYNDNVIYDNYYYVYIKTHDKLNIFIL